MRDRRRTGKEQIENDSLDRENATASNRMPVGFSRRFSALFVEGFDALYALGLHAAQAASQLDQSKPAH
jgi:hypothetical protein